MKRLLIDNPDILNAEKTFLTAAYSSGVALSVVNTFAFAASDLGLVGKPGEEKAEIKKISTITSDTALAIESALKFSHSESDPIYKIPYDYVSIEAKLGTGDWTVLSLSGLQYDKQRTIYIHDDGSSSYSYRWRFQNSVTGDYSDYSPTISGAGFSNNQVGYMVREVRGTTGLKDNNEVVTNIEIVRFLSNGQDIVSAIRKDWRFLRFAEDSSITTIASQFKYNLDLISGITLGFIKKIRYRLVDSNSDRTEPITFKTEDEFDDYIRDNERTDDDDVVCYTIRPPDTSSTNGYIEVYPTPKTTGAGTFYIRGFQKMSRLTSDTDETLIPVPSILENYAIAQIERIRGNDKKADYYEGLFYGPSPKAKDRTNLTGIALLEQLQAQSRPTGQPRSLVTFRGRGAHVSLYSRQRLELEEDDD